MWKILITDDVMSLILANRICRCARTTDSTMFSLSRRLSGLWDELLLYKKRLYCCCEALTELDYSSDLPITPVPKAALQEFELVLKELSLVELFGSRVCETPFKCAIGTRL
jgi:hypothetical protein